jgi:hypothetical protein
MLNAELQSEESRLRCSLCQGIHDECLLGNHFIKQLFGILKKAFTG